MSGRKICVKWNEQQPQLILTFPLKLLEILKKQNSPTSVTKPLNTVHCDISFINGEISIVQDRCQHDVAFSQTLQGIR